MRGRTYNLMGWGRQWKKEEKERTLVRFAKHMTGTAGAAGEERPARWAARQNLAENKEMPLFQKQVQSALSSLWEENKQPTGISPYSKGSSERDMGGSYPHPQQG